MTMDPNELKARMISAAPDIELSFRAMFGGIMGYAAGRPFASLSNVGLALKLTGTNRDAALALPDAAPLRYEPDAPPSKSYVVLPTAIVDDDAALRDWMVRSAEALPQPKAKKA
jgi:TfoX/Sxy family transcriptional regulator of competence genes